MTAADPQRLTLFITHVSAETSSIKLWAQLDVHTSEQIEACLVELEPKFEIGEDTPHPVDIQPGGICCAKCTEDGKWYRARITTLCNVLSGKVGVKFIDYGNTETILLKDVRKTDNPVCQIAPQATEFILADVKPVGGTWHDKTVAFLVKTLRYQQVEAKIVRRVGSANAISVSVVYNDVVEDLSNLLVKMAMGVKETLELKYSQQNVALNEDCTVYMGTVTSLDEFVLNLTDTEDDLLQLNEDINKYTSEKELEKLANPKIGTPCLAKFQQDDAFYRAEVQGINNNTYRIVYVDYSNADHKSASELYAIPAHLVTQLPAQGLKCRLKDHQNIPETASVIQLFKTKTAEQELKCRFLSVNADDWCTVELRDENDVDLSDLLKESRAKLIPNASNSSPSFVQLKLQVGNAHEVEITHVDALDPFYIRLLSNRGCYNELEEQLHVEMNASVSPLVDTEVVKGLVCVVRKNFTWYRCQVVEIVSPGLARVQYVDVGDADVVPTTRLKRLPSAYARDPPVLAKACALNNCTHNSPDLSFDLERLTARRKLLAHVKGEHDGRLLVDLFNVLAIPHVDINKQVNQLRGAQRAVIADPELDRVETVYVMNVDDDGVIYAQLTKFDADKLEELQSKLNCCYGGKMGKMGKMVDANDRFCCAQFSDDGLFYRGEILKEVDGDLEVYFVDYGNVEVKAKEGVRKLDCSFAVLPRQVVRMRLVGEDFFVDQEFKGVFLEETMEVQFVSRSKKMNYFVVTANPMNGGVKVKMAELQINQVGKKVERVVERVGKASAKYLPPVLGEKENVIVTHCVSPSLIGCQLQKNAVDLRNLCEVTTASAKGADSKKRRLQSPFVGQPCIADYYGDWYRAEIKKVCSDEEIEVIYIDFGNSEKINLDLVQTVSPEFLNLPKQCIFCKLDGCDETNWTKRENETLDEIIKEKLLTAVFNNIGGKNEPYSVTLFDGPHNLNQKFMKTIRPEQNIQPRGFGSQDKYAKNTWGNNTPENDPKPQYNSNDYNSNRKQNFTYEEKKRSYNANTTNNKQTNGWNKPNWNCTDEWNAASDHSPPADTWSDNAEMRKQTLKHSPFSICETKFYTGNYKCISLTPGTTKDAAVSFGDTPSEFYVQLVENNEKLVALGDNLAVEYNDDYQALTDLKIDSPCCVKYAEDGNWYRAVVTSCCGTEIDIKYVDYGNTDKVKPECVKGLKREFGELPIQAVKCSLDNVKAINDDGRFAELVLDKDLTLKVVGVGATNGNLLVEMFDSTDSSIAQLLVDEGVATYEKTAARSLNGVELVVGTTCDVTLTWFVSPTWFYVNSHNEKGALDRMMDAIQDFYALEENSAFGVPEWKEGTACVAQFSEDDVWYRARIAAVMDDGGIRVEYVDFGNGEVTNKKRILGLEMRFAELPPQAIKCRLRSVRPVGAKWENITQNKMESYFGVKSSCTFYAFHKGAFLVDVENEGHSVAQSLVNDGLALFSSVCSTSVTSASSEVADQAINPYPPFRMEWSKDEYKDVVVCSLGRIDRFWCQLLNCQNRTLASRLNEYYGEISGSDQKLTNPKKGTACVIKSARNENWYRAVVQNRPSPSKLSVLCVDVGMEETIHISQAKIIATQFLEYPIAAFPCTLQGVPTSIDPDEFIRATYMKELVAQIKDQVSDWFEVTLFELNEKEDKNLNELLAATVVVAVPEADVNPSDTVNIGGGVESKRMPYFLEKQLDPDSFDLLAPFAALDSQWAVDEEKCVRILNFGTPSAFWCQLASAKDEMDVLQQRLEDFYANKLGAGVSDWPACKPCVIKSKIDNKWYRASVIRRRSLDEIEVLLIDVGLEDDVSEIEIREISDEFLKIAPHSFHCRLANLVDTDADPSQFMSLVGEELIAKLHNISDKNVHEVSLYTSSSGEPENILSLLTHNARSEPDAHFLPPDVQWGIGEIKHLNVTGPGLPDQFWCQLKDDMAKFDELCEEMESHYNPIDSDKSAVIMPTVGKAVVVRSKNNRKWHRAIVRSIINSSKVMVSFVDTGEWEKVGITQLKAITPELMSRPVLAAECRLSGIPENAEVRKMGYDFFDMTVDAELKAALINRVGTAFEVTLFDGEVNLNDKLVSIYQGKLIETIVAYKSPVIIPGTHDGFLSHVANPRHFYVQLVLIQDDLLELNEQLSAIYSTMEPNESTLPSDALPGQPCCAPFEDAWYRGELLSTDGNCAVVKFIDYGNCETLSRDKVKQLDAEIVNSTTPLAIECRLDNAPDRSEWSADELENFHNMVVDKQLCVEFITCEEPCNVIIRANSQSEPMRLPGWEKPQQETHQVEMTPNILDGIGKSDLLYREFPAGKRLLGGITHIVSPGQFWVQLDDDTKQLEGTMEMLEDVYVTNHVTAPEMTRSELRSGAACAAQYSQDGGWYRGKVLAVELDDVHVQFVDYGNSDTVKLAAVRRLTSELQQVPVLAVECELDGVCQLEEEWSIEAIELFEELVSDKSLLVEFARASGEKYFVRIMDMGMDVAEEMGAKGLATLKEGYGKRAVVGVGEGDAVNGDDVTVGVGVGVGVGGGGEDGVDGVGVVEVEVCELEPEVRRFVEEELEINEELKNGSEKSILVEERNVESIEVEEKNEESIEIEKKSDNSIEGEEKNEESIEIEKKSDNSIEIEEKNEKSIEIVENSDKLIVIEEVLETGARESTKIDDKCEKSIEIEGNIEKSIKTEGNIEKSIKIEETIEKSIKIEETIEKSIKIEETNEKSIDIEETQEISTEIEDAREESTELEDTQEESTDTYETTIGIDETHEKSIEIEADKSFEIVELDAKLEKSIEIVKLNAIPEKSIEIQQLETETKMQLDSQTETHPEPAEESPIRIDYTLTHTDDKPIPVEPIDETNVDTAHPEPSTLYTSIEDCLDLSPGEISSDMQEESFTTATDDVISYEDARVELSEQSGGFDTQSLLLDEDDEDLFESEDTFPASISAILDSSAEASQCLDVSCTTISSSFEYEKVGPATKKQRTEAGQSIENIYAEIKRLEDDIVE